MGYTDYDVYASSDDGAANGAIRTHAPFSISKGQPVLLNLEFPFDPLSMTFNPDDTALYVFQDNPEFGDQGAISIQPLKSSYTWAEVQAGALVSQPTMGLINASSTTAVFTLSGPAMNHFSDYSYIRITGIAVVSFTAKLNKVASHFT